jgi:V/A-type H+/Na+-transporting ATPase subunit I
LMFDMMFGDAGHGAVLAIGGLAARLAGRSKTLRDGGLLLLFAGLSSMVFGCIYGSCFGLAALKKYALWHDPLEGDPMALMTGAIGIGVVMISLGLILNVINRFRRGDVIGGFLDKFGVVGVLFYWGALALITKHAALESRGLVKPAVAFFLAVPLAGWALKEPLEYFLHRRSGHAAGAPDGLLGAVIESLVGAFEAVLSYLANTISFVRLAAYAMSHAALLLAAFMMAAEVKRVAVGGSLLSVLVIILGNVVAIVLEGIIASVQALRLEYYEFFGKFFSGNGRPFTPFRLLAYGHTTT